LQGSEALSLASSYFRDDIITRVSHTLVAGADTCCVLRMLAEAALHEVCAATFPLMRRTRMDA
jgi:hypothetical protein